MPPRKKTTQVDAIKNRVAEAAGTVQELAAKDTLTKRLSGIEETLTGKITLAEREAGALRQDLTLLAAKCDNLFAQSATQIGTVDSGLAELQERIRTHEVSGATRRAAIASRIAGLEKHATGLDRFQAEGGFVHEDQLSQGLRNLWLAIAGIGVGLVTVGIKVFTS